MRLLRLGMTAFGPFAGTEEIRFDALGESRIFLINGPTGAGKTSILDAICYALYDETTGNERKGHQMRCDSAPLASLTEVVLDFAIAERRFRIRRVPEQTRAAKGGSGTARQTPEAQLWELEPGVELVEKLPADRTTLLVAKKITEATQAIRNITGMTAEQFRQVMVLPQGRFRELLVASSDDRERIFSELFETSVYKQLERKLKDAAAAIEADVDRHRERQRVALAQHSLENPDELVHTIERAHADLAAAKTAMAESKTESESATQRLQAGRELVRKFELLATAGEDAKRLELLAPVQERRRARLALAKAASALRSLHDDWLRLDRDHTNAAEALALATTKLASATTTLEATRAEATDLDALRAELALQRKTLHDLEAYRERARTLATAQDNQRACAAALKTAQQAVDEQNTVVEHELAEVAKHEVRIAALSEQTLELAAKEVEFVTLHAAVETRRRLETQRTAAERKRLEVEAAAEAWTRARERAELARRSCAALEAVWRDAQAAILAAGLEDGAPCPVCGSEAHPRRAHAQADLPTEHDLETARSASEKAARDAATREKAHAELVRDLENLRDRIASDSGGDESQPATSLDDLCAKHARLAVELPELREAARELTRERAALTTTNGELQESRAQLNLATNELHEAKVQSRTAAAETRTAAAELPELYREAGALRAAIETRHAANSELEQRIEALESGLKAAEGAHREAATFEKVAREGLEPRRIAFSNAEAAWEAALGQSVFDDRAAFEAAVTEPGELEQLEREIRIHDDATLASATTLANAERAVGEQPAPDLTALELSEKTAKQTYDAHHTAHAKQKLALDNLLQTQQTLTAAAAEQRSLEQKYLRIGRLAEIANGKNPDNVSLQRFVLAALLDDVLLEADLRLSAMTRGRFRLERKADVTHRGRKAGLDLEVADAYTGTTRAVATLSGGESFMAALSLALGLSAVVQAYSGGIRLDTLFIDEGFGSLDAESLDLALNALFDLQASGRTVGVISHIAMLRERIDTRIDIDVSRDGSRTRLALP